MMEMKDTRGVVSQLNLLHYTNKNALTYPASPKIIILTSCFLPEAAIVNAQLLPVQCRKQSVHRKKVTTGTALEENGSHDHVGQDGGGGYS